MKLGKLDQEIFDTLRYGHYKSSTKIKSEIIESRLEKNIEKGISPLGFYSSVTTLSKLGFIQSRAVPIENMDPEKYKRRAGRGINEYSLTEKGNRHGNSLGYSEELILVRI